MNLPISFEEVSHFKNEYRGDLIITKNVMYYFPHTRVSYARLSGEIGGENSMVLFDLLGNFVPFFAAVPWLRLAADKSLKVGKFLKRAFRPTINSPQIRQQNLWQATATSESLQVILDEYMEIIKQKRVEFSEDSIPKPARFSADEIENRKFGLKFKFDAKYDNHDFRVNLLHRNLFKKALSEGGFLR